MKNNEARRDDNQLTMGQVWNDLPEMQYLNILTYRIICFDTQFSVYMAQTKKL